MAVGGRGRLLALQTLVSLLALAGVAWFFARQELPNAAVGRGRRRRAWRCAGALRAWRRLLRGERWHRLLGRGTRADAYALTTVGYMGNNALPARAGDVLKAMLDRPSARELARREAFGTLVAERLLDALALATIFAALVVAGGLPLGLSTGTLLALGAGLAAVTAAILLFAPRLRGIVAALLIPSRELLSARGRRLLRAPAVLWLAEGGVYAMLGDVAGIHLGLADGLYVMALANIAAMVPAAPGYIGTYDAAVLLGVRLAAGAGSRRGAALRRARPLRAVRADHARGPRVLLLARYGGFASARGRGADR